MNGSTTIDKRGGAGFSAGSWAWRRAGLGRRTNLERIDPDRLGDILEFGLAKVADHEIEAPLDLPIGVLRQADRSGLRDSLETRGDIDAVAHQVSIALFDHVAEMNADPELNAALRRQAGVALQESMLQLDRAAYCVDHAAKFDDEAVARALDHSSSMDGDRRLDQVAPQRAQTRQDPILVGARQPRVADDIRHENRRQFARLSHRLNSLRFALLYRAHLATIQDLRVQASAR